MDPGSESSVTAHTALKPSERIATAFRYKGYLGIVSMAPGNALMCGGGSGAGALLVRRKPAGASRVPLGHARAQSMAAAGLPTTLLQISPASRYLVRVATPSLGQVSS
jgi:hypothetical protein